MIHIQYMYGRIFTQNYERYFLNKYSFHKSINDNTCNFIPVDLCNLY